ncbi:MAG: heavy metal translocating P-type ATPase [Acutalibacteraceae bacterium]|nr:heavy metal translocating P-type ATPase [Oscillospiraceae bacterium]
MTKKQKTLLIKIIAAAVLYAVGLLIPFRTAKTVLYIAAYAAVGYSVVIKAVRNIAHGQVFDENFLMLIATIGAFGLKDYPEAVAVMLFYQVGELFESVAVGRSRESVSQLINLAPDFANKKVGGEIVEIMPEEVEIGDTIVVKPGEKIPLDGKVVSGETVIDTSALTGESMPRELKVGDEALSGCINLGGVIEIEVTKEFEDSCVSKIMYLIEEASSQKAKSESFITKFAKVYTPCVVAAAVLLAVVPTIFTGNFTQWLSRALLFLVVSCPCALVISVPLTFFCAIGKASRSGILIKGSNFLEQLSKAKIAVFDKTGTLTKGKFSVQSVTPNGVGEEELTEICALAEGYTDHPIAQSVKQAYGKKIELDRIGNSAQLTGFGVKATVDGREVYVGNAKLMEQQKIEFTEKDSPFTILYVAVDGAYIGCIEVADEIKEHSAEAVGKLKKSGIEKTVMLTGDNEKIGRVIAQRIGIDEVHAGLLPSDKSQELKEIKKDGITVYTGDGLNDAPVIIEADVGIAMGALGSDAAIEAADIVIMDDDIAKIPAAVKISRKTMRLVKENIWFALIVKFAIMVLGAIGIANMWLAVFADVGVSIIAILNALRIQR